MLPAQVRLTKRLGVRAKAPKPWNAAKAKSTASVAASAEPGFETT